MRGETMVLRYDMKEIATTVLLEGWLEGLRCICLDRDGRRYEDAHVPLPLSHLPDAFLALADIPVDLQEAARPYGELALRMLSLARQQDACADLLLCRPDLLLLAVLHWPQDNQPILTYAARGQRALLQAMGLMPRRSLLHFLDRLRLDLARDWQRDYLQRWLHQQPEAYLQLQHEPELRPAQLFLLLHAPELTGSALARAVRFAYDQPFWFRRTMDILTPALSLARSGQFPGGLGALCGMTSLLQVAAVVRQVQEAADRARQFRHLCDQLALAEPAILAQNTLSLGHLQTPWLQQVVSWPQLDAACAALEPRACDVWSPTLLNDVLRGRQALFRLCSPRRNRTLGWVRLAVMESSPGQCAQTALIAASGPHGGRLPAFWWHQLRRHLATRPLCAA